MKKTRSKARILSLVLGGFLIGSVVGCSGETNTVVPGDPVENRKKKADAVNGASAPVKSKKGKSAAKLPGDDI